MGLFFIWSPETVLSCNWFCVCKVGIPFTKKVVLFRPTPYPSFCALTLTMYCPGGNELENSYLNLPLALVFVPTVPAAVLMFTRTSDIGLLAWLVTVPSITGCSPTPILLFSDFTEMTRLPIGIAWALLVINNKGSTNARSTLVLIICQFLF